MRGEVVAGEVAYATLSGFWLHRGKSCFDIQSGYSGVPCSGPCVSLSGS
jgi:hypothetical protein